MGYSPEQLRHLKANPNVLRCSAKSITYSPDFKQQAVKAYYGQGLGPNQIFQNAGFDLNVLGKDRPKESLKLWRQIYKAKGLSGLAKEQRGLLKRGKVKVKYDESDPAYLKAKIAYLEAENAFLRKLKTKPNN